MREAAGLKVAVVTYAGLQTSRRIGQGLPERQHGKENFGRSALGFVAGVDDFEERQSGVFVRQVVCNLLGDGHNVRRDALNSDEPVSVHASNMYIPTRKFTPRPKVDADM